MKACRNCRRIWPDEYNGQCEDCGAPMSGVQANGGDDLARRWANQLRRGEAEASMEATFRRGRGHDSVPIHEAVLEKTRAMLTPKEGAFTDEA